MKELAWYIKLCFPPTPLCLFLASNILPFILFDMFLNNVHYFYPKIDLI